MIGQTALLVELSDASCQHARLDGTPSFVGAFDACIDAARLFGDQLPTRAEPRLFALGIGPLAGSSIPGCNHLAIATHSLLSDTPQVASLAGGGLLLDGIERSPIVLHGCAPRPSALLIRRRSGESEIRLVEMPPFSSPTPGDPRGTASALLATLLERLDLADDQTLLLTGPAARVTRYGALLLAQVRGGRASPLLDATPRGGFGSTLWHRHRLCAICLASDRSAAALVRRSPAPTGQLARRFHPGMSSDELEHTTGCNVDSRLIDGGTALRQLEAAGSELLCFNATSIYRSPEQRDELYERVVRSHLIGKLKLSLAEHATQHLDCGAPCPLACRKISSGTLRDFELHAQLGPQLGIFERAALDPLVQRCLDQGFDAASVGAILGWLLERLAREELSPADLDVTQVPRWSHVDFDAEADSQLNALLALRLLDALLTADWADPLRRGLRHALSAGSGQSGNWALFVELGQRGEVPLSPIWSLGNLAPSPLPGDAFSYQGRHFLPPRQLGRACAQRLVAQLGLTNHGLCGQHRVWLEAHYPSLLSELYEWPDQWLKHHKALARRLVRATDFRFWSTARTIDFVEQRLRHHQLDGAADAALDTWVRRFAQSSASAARAFWSETLAGLTQELAA